MHTVRTKLEGDVVFSRDTMLDGTVSGSARVTPGTLLDLRGMIAGDLTLEPNSVVELRGTVNGNVTNIGGRLEVYGVVNGSVFARSGQTTVDPKAVVAAVHRS
jgi:cytoskeletal protein CcmA (bactofilin family)